MRCGAHLPARYGFFILVLALVAVVPAAPSFAGSSVGPDVAVRYSDLDLATVEGATTMLRRINAAAKRVCAPLYHGTLGSMVKRDTCQNQLIAETVAKMNRPVLAAVYASSRKKTRTGNAMSG
jgi:UrcA family protein